MLECVAQLNALPGCHFSKKTITFSIVLNHHTDAAILNVLRHFGCAPPNAK